MIFHYFSCFRYFQWLLLCVCTVVLSGCTALAKPTVTPETVLPNAPIPFAALPTDYELPPYIRIVDLPLVDVPDSLAQHTALLGEAWLFEQTGFTLLFGRWPNRAAAAVDLASLDLDPDQMHWVSTGSDEHPDMMLLYGAFNNPTKAHNFRKRFDLASVSVKSFRDLKAERCAQLDVHPPNPLCDGATVRTLRLAEVFE